MIHEIDLTIDKRFDLTGMELAAATQALLYKGIRERASLQKCQQTLLNIEKVKSSVFRLTGRSINKSWIWRSLRDKAIRRQVSDFLWKSLHNAYRVGEFWLCVPGHEERGTCPECNETESMEHILFQCRMEGRSRIWDLAKAAWSKTGQRWFGEDLGTLVGCRSFYFPNRQEKKTNAPTAEPRGKKKRPNGISSRCGIQRLFIILMTEAAFLIWKLRNERRIREADNAGFRHSETEIENRWFKVLNDTAG